jgi:phage terminase large subunit-like protein
VSVYGDAVNLMASLVLESGARWGEVADAVQRADAERVLDPDYPAPYGFVTRARGYDKTGGSAGLGLSIMLTQSTRADRLYYLAADRDQGRLAVDSIEGYVARTPELQGALDVGTYRATARRSGAVLEVVPADAASAFGLRPSFLVVDEVAQWGETGAPRRLFDATTSALAKIPGARCLVVTTAGDPGHWSHGVLEHARADPLWWVHEVPGPPPWADRARLDEQRRRLLPSVFTRLFENVWTSAEDALVADEDLRACVVLDGPLEPRRGVRYRVGVDIGLRRDATAVAVGHAEGVGPEHRVVLDRMVRLVPRRGVEVALSDVEEAVLEVSRAYNGAAVSLDPWQGIGSAQRLRTRQVNVEEFAFTATSVGRLAAVLHQLLRDRKLALYPDRELLAELGRVRLRESSPGVVRMDHTASGHDDQAIALALMALPLVQRSSAGFAVSVARRVVGSPRPGAVSVAHHEILGAARDSRHVRRMADGREIPVSDREARREMHGEPERKLVSDKDPAEQGRWRDLARRMGRR